MFVDNYFRNKKQLYAPIKYEGNLVSDEACIPNELQSYKPTVEELHRGEFEIEGETLILDLLDTSGTHQFPAMRELAIKQSDAVVLVYAINDTESWEMLKMLKDEQYEGSIVTLLTTRVGMPFKSLSKIKC
ncbi:Dexamethasone-induced Ras-related protein 1 [Armadillidium vulgare]|nr:Dexamethasone-induced Ras-related protein 1 [Armadillidium vulgare]